MTWQEGPGIVVLPDGARLRGRGLRGDPPDGPPPEFAVYLRGRTGTALACIAQLAGVPAVESVQWVHHPKAIETPWQRRYVERFERSRP